MFFEGCISLRDKWVCIGAWWLLGEATEEGPRYHQGHPSPLYNSQSTFHLMLLGGSFRVSLIFSRTVCSFCFWAISDWVTSATLSFSLSSFSGKKKSSCYPGPQTALIYAPVRPLIAFRFPNTPSGPSHPCWIHPTNSLSSPKSMDAQCPYIKSAYDLCITFCTLNHLQITYNTSAMPVLSYMLWHWIVSGIIGKWKSLCGFRTDAIFVDYFWPTVGWICRRGARRYRGLQPWAPARGGACSLPGGGMGGTRSGRVFWLSWTFRITKIGCFAPPTIFELSSIFLGFLSSFQFHLFRGPLCTPVG